MCSTYTSKQTSKCSTNFIFRFFLENFLPQLLKLCLTLKLANIIIKVSTTPNAYDTPQDNINPTPTTPPYIHSLLHNHPLSLVPRNYRNTLANHGTYLSRISFPRLLVSHLAFQQSNTEVKYEKTIEQPHTQFRFSEQPSF